MAFAAEKLESFGTEFEFCDEIFLIDPRGCVYWPTEKLLLVSDLHLEKGSSFAMRRGTFLPPYDTQATLELLAHCIANWQPKRLVSLGDSFHDAEASFRLPQSCLLGLRQLMKNREWIWIGGNHDPDPPTGLGGMFCTEMQIGPLHLKHDPAPQFRKGEIAGHLHPKAKIRQRGKTVRRRCVVSDGERVILPAFGAFTGGLNIRDCAFDNLFRPEKLKAWLLGKNRVYPISNRQLIS